MILKNLVTEVNYKTASDSRNLSTNRIKRNDGYTNINPQYCWLGYGTSTLNGAFVMANDNRAYDCNGTLSNNNPSAGNFSGQTILVGSSTTPATFTDYTLGSRIDSTVLESVSPPSLANNNYNGQFTITHTLRNITSDDVTVNEIGFASGGTPNGNTLTMPNYALWTREVLSTPVVIPAGEQKTFTLTIDFNKMSTGYSAA